MKGNKAATDYSNTPYRFILAQLPSQAKDPVPGCTKPILPASQCIMANSYASPNNDPALDALIKLIAHEVIQGFYSCRAGGSHYKSFPYWQWILDQRIVGGQSKEGIHG